MYPHTEYLDALGLSKIDFERIAKMSSWATCSKRQSEDQDEHGDTLGEEADADETT